MSMPSLLGEITYIEKLVLEACINEWAIPVEKHDVI